MSKVREGPSVGVCSRNGVIYQGTVISSGGGVEAYVNLAEENEENTWRALGIFKGEERNWEQLTFYTLLEVNEGGACHEYWMDCFGGRAG